MNSIATPTDQTLLGIVFAFDVESLGPEQAFIRAWQLWMERLDPAEMRGVAIYDGALPLPGLPLITVIAVSGPSHAVAYVREAFAAPDLAAYPGIAPLSHRFIDGLDLPRERLVLRGYINDLHQFVPQQEAIPLFDIARHAGWPVAKSTDQQAQSPPPERPRAPVADAAGQETRALQTARTDGATQVMMRLWQSSFRAEGPAVNRWRLYAIIGLVVIVGSLGLLGMRIAAQLRAPRATPTPTGQQTTPLTHSTNAILVAAPLTVRVPCTPGETTRFTLSNNGAAPLIWSSNGAQFDPPLAFSVMSDTLAANASETIVLTTREYVTTSQVARLNITSNGGTTQILIMMGACRAPTATPQG
jgi:hypothetical protein